MVIRYMQLRPCGVLFEGVDTSSRMNVSGGLIVVWAQELVGWVEVAKEGDRMSV